MWIQALPPPPQAESLELLQNSGQRLGKGQENILSHFSWQSSQTTSCPSPPSWASISKLSLWVVSKTFHCGRGQQGLPPIVTVGCHGIQVIPWIGRQLATKAGTAAQGENTCVPLP